MNDIDLLKRFLTFLVNLVHTVSLVPVIDHDMVAVGETANFFAVTSINGGQIAVCQNRLWQTVAVHRCGVWQFGRGRLKISNLTFYFFLRIQFFFTLLIKFPIFFVFYAKWIIPGIIISNIEIFISIIIFFNIIIKKTA